MTQRERLLAVLNYQPYDRLPLVHFGFLSATIDRWAAEGHLTADEARLAKQGDGSPGEQVLADKLGFDHNYHIVFAGNVRLDPGFESKVLEELPGGNRKVLTGNGAVILTSDDNQSIPAEVDHLLKDRASWEELFLPRLRFRPERIVNSGVPTPTGRVPFAAGGREILNDPARDWPVLLHCGSLYGAVRDYVGVEHLAYLTVDDEPLLDEILEVTADLCYRCAETVLTAGARFDLGHFWEDICYKNGPLVNPRLFAAKVGPHYRRLTDLLARHGLDLVSLDCDGLIDALIPTWIENGVNVMFPIEVGTWHATFAPWRERWGQAIRGVGGLDKRVFARDRAAVDAELERLKPLVELGGYLPCPDHRLPHDNRWENVQYFCERYRATFG